MDPEEQNRINETVLWVHRSETRAPAIPERTPRSASLNSSGHSIHGMQLPSTASHPVSLQPSSPALPFDLSSDIRTARQFTARAGGEHHRRHHQLKQSLQRGHERSA
jgi:hypothetical protein